ncbi:MAG: hypothetical protein QOF53_3068 [Nocardioidaceae bacterium]|jgi:hypothetical protein|nr:hypothetical protein [Nocardioidaceae bacterium]
MGGSPERAQEPVERFKPTSGGFVGWAGIAVAVLIIVYVAVRDHSVLGLRLALASAFGGVLIWVTQLRPRATAYPHELLLLGSVKDVFVPYVAINEVTMGQTLNVWVGRRRFICVGIGRSIGFEMRQRVRSHGQGGQLGGNRSYQFAGRAETTQYHDSGMTYQVFVLNRINDLVAAARSEQDRQDAHAPVPPVRSRYAVPEILAVLLTGAAFVASLLV